MIKLLRSWVIVLGLVVFAGLTAGSNCQPKPILADLGHCEASAAVKDLPALVPILGAILASGGTNAAVDAALIGLALKFGADSVDCGIAAVLTGLTQVVAVPATQPTKTVGVSLAQLRAQTWLATRGHSTRTVAP